MVATQKRIGLLGGTFNPIHNGHLHLAKALKVAHQLDEIWFLPANISPHKLETLPVLMEHRLRMVELAIEGEPSYRICDIESKREGPSFTIDTLRLLKKDYPNTHFYLLIGEDSAHSFLKWREPREIARLAAVIVGSRGKHDSALPELIAQGYTPIEVLNVSSTEIRRKLAAHQDCSPLLPLKVYKYILDNGLYRT